jgi:type I restriction enzyme S subunit
MKVPMIIDEPPRWDEKQLQELVSFQKGHVVTTHPYETTGALPYIGAENFGGAFTLYTRDPEAVVCEPTDILMLWDGERSGLCSKGLQGAIGSTVARLRPRGGIDGGYLYHQLTRYFPWIQARRTGTGVPHVPKDLARILWVPLPNDEEQQRRISEVLDTLDEAILKTEAVIAKLKQIRAGLLHDLLTRGIDENGELRDPIAHAEQFKTSPLGQIPRDWDVLSLSWVAEVDREKFAHRPRNAPAFYGGPFPFIQTGDVAFADGEEIAEASQSLNERGVSVSKEFPKGTIAVTIAANIGDTAILGKPMYFPDSVVGVIVHANHIVRWIELVLRRAKKQLNALAPQSAQKNINLEFLRPLLVPVPQPEEQERCSQIYDSVGEQIKTELRALHKLGALRFALMDDLLTGHVRVPEGII